MSVIFSQAISSVNKQKCDRYKDIKFETISRYWLWPTWYIHYS